MNCYFLFHFLNFDMCSILCVYVSVWYFLCNFLQTIRTFDYTKYVFPKFILSSDNKNNTKIYRENIYKKKQEVIKKFFIFTFCFYCFNPYIHEMNSNMLTYVCMFTSRINIHKIHNNSYLNFNYILQDLFEYIFLKR